MNETIVTTRQQIKKDPQIIKFSLYGFLKNLKFFEPFLVLYLLNANLNLFQVGILYSIREIVNTIFEIPSGVFADKYGKKTELSLCFIFYIVSFVFFFIGGNFWILAIAMFFFGLGEAFRSGTHKAMIYGYLEEKKWFKEKSFVYGRTRSFSLLGSAISAFLSILFVLKFENLNVLFLLGIIPYILDFFLILSYPARFNEKEESDFKFSNFFNEMFGSLKTIVTDQEKMRIMLSSSSFDAIFKSIKDYIQPILQGVLLVSPILLFKNLSSQDTLELSLAIIYGFFYIFSAIGSRNVYRLSEKKSSRHYMNLFYDVFAILFMVVAISIRFEAVYIIIPLYLLLFVLKDVRRPLFVDVIGDEMVKKERVTVLSVESQFKALFVAVFAPLFGFVADQFSIPILFFGIGVISLGMNRYFSRKPTPASVSKGED